MSPATPFRSHEIHNSICSPASMPVQPDQRSRPILLLKHAERGTSRREELRLNLASSRRAAYFNQKPANPARSTCCQLPINGFLVKNRPRESLPNTHVNPGLLLAPLDYEDTVMIGFVLRAISPRQ
jgi:hypothetical protein